MQFSIRTFVSSVAAAAVTIVLSGALPAQAAVGDLYAATGAGTGDNCSGGTPSSLYTLDPADGSASLIGPIMIGAEQVRHVTGLAVHPSTGVLYAVMNGQDTSGTDCSESTLLTIDPATGAATIVGTQGSLSGPIPDITFDPYGTLYGWSEGIGDELIVIDTTDGTYTQPGFGDHDTYATGLASDSKGRLYLKIDNLLERLNQYTGEAFGGVTLDRQAHNMLAFDAADVMYSGRRTGSGFTLFTIDPETGVTVTRGSNTVFYIAALAFDRGVVTEPPVSDLSVEKEVDEPIALIGTDVVFTLTLYNTGPDDAENVVVSDALPSNFTYVSSTGDGSYDETAGEWTVGTITANSTASIEITATGTTEGFYTNRAEVSASDSYDPDSVPGSGDEGSNSYFEVSGQVALPTLFSIDRDDPYLWVLQPDLSESDKAQELSLSGFSICGGNGLATQPVTDTLFGVVAVDDCSTRRLVTIDPVSADATDVGGFGGTRIAAIAFGADQNTLYATSGNNGSPQRTLFTVDPSDATLTPECVLPSSDYGRALAFGDGMIFDATMDCALGCQLVIRAIDPASFPADPADPCPVTSYETGLPREATSLAIKEVGADFITFLVGSFSELYEVTVPGDVDPVDTAFVGYLNHNSKGMAFVATTVTTADLTVSKSATKNRVKGSKFIEYVLQAQNNGPDSVQNVVLTDEIPFGTTLVSLGSGCFEGGGVVTCDVGTLDSGVTQFYSMVVQVTCKKCSSISNTVVIGTDTDVYETPFNNSWTINTTVKGKF